MKIVYYLIFTLSSINIYAQPNCEAFRYYFNDTLKYEACKVAEQIEGHYQFSKEYQKVLDESIRIDSSFAYAYRKKSTAYLKSGDFINWKKLMDKAVKFNPKENLEYRGLMRYKCFSDYKGALCDFKRLDSLGVRIDHLTIAKALCYKSIGKKQKAIQVLEMQLNKDDDLGLQGYLHLGVLYLEQKKYKNAIQAFLKQNDINELAESRYYLALAYKALKMKPEYTKCLKEAKRLYLKERRLFDIYINPIHKIYLEHIENEMKTTYNNNDSE